MIVRPDRFVFRQQWSEAVRLGMRHNDSVKRISCPGFSERYLRNDRERVIAGESVEFVHQGNTIRLVIPEHSSSKLDRLTPRQISNPDMTEKEHRAAERKMQAEILAEMQKDWAEI